MDVYFKAFARVGVSEALHDARGSRAEDCELVVQHGKLGAALTEAVVGLFVCLLLAEVKVPEA